MHTIAQVLNPDFARSWHEAVAVVQEAASQLVPGVSLPAPDDLLLDSSGVLSFGFGSEGNDNPVAALADLLQQLLKGVEAPPSLVELVNANLGPEPALASVDSFMRSLAFFERPNRANDLRAIAGRLDGSESKPAGAEEFERLRERVMAASEAPATITHEESKKPEKPPIRKRRTRQRRVVAAGIAAGLLIGILAVRYPVNIPLSLLSSATANSETPAAAAASETSGNSTDAKSSPTAPTTGKRAGEPLEKPRQNAASKQSTAEKSVGSSAGENSGTSAVASAKPELSKGSDVPRPGLASRSLSPTTVRTEPVTVPPAAEKVPPTPRLPRDLPSASVAPPESGVYSPETPGVKPPRLVRPQMPQEPKPGDDTGYFDMIVDEKGLVEQVKLISPRRRYHDRMLVAAAKAWQFSPATLDGQPVKYRLLVPIILSGLPY